MTLFTPIGSADVIYLSETMSFSFAEPLLSCGTLRVGVSLRFALMEHRANSDPFDAADTSSRSASDGAGDDTFSLYYVY